MDIQRIFLGLVACVALLALSTTCVPSALLPEARREKGIAETPTTEEREILNMSDQVTAEVILRSADGSSILDAKEGITAGTIEKYRVGEEVIEEASERLEALGFKVLQRGPVGLTISGNSARFEAVFQSTLEARSTEVMETKAEGGVAEYYEFTQPISIPEDLSSLVADVTLPSPPQFFP